MGLEYTRAIPVAVEFGLLIVAIFTTWLAVRRFKRRLAA